MHSIKQFKFRHDDSRIRNIVSVVISARQASIFQEVEGRISRIIEERLDSAVTNALGRLNFSDQSQNVSSGNACPFEQSPNYKWPENIHPSLHQSQNSFPQPNRSESRVNDSSVITTAGRIAGLINNWDVKFDGSPNQSVENFIYQMESLGVDTLGGNFNLLCENMPCLFTGEAKHWYWRYRRSVERITWHSVCQDLRTNFEEHRSDTEIKEDMGSRKQGPNELFEDYKNVMLRLSEFTYAT